MSSTRYRQVTTLRPRARALPLSEYLARRRPDFVPRTRQAMIPVDADYAMTADCVVDDPREPSIIPTGVLDHRGQMLVRVSVPIKVPMGFHRRMPEPADQVEAIVPEDMLAVSDCGLGVGYVTPEEADDEAVDVEALVRAALHQAGGDPHLAKRLLAEQGYEVEFQVRAVDGETR